MQYPTMVGVMVGLNRLIMLRSAFTIRNISTTSYLCRAKPKVPLNMVLINKLSDPGRVQISFAVKHNEKIQRVGFVRPLGNGIQPSFERMSQKLKRETMSTADFALTLYNPANRSATYESDTWESLLDILPRLRLQVNGQDYQIAYNLPVIKRIDFPKFATAGLDLHPIAMDYTGTLTDFQFQWYRKRDEGKWRECDNQTHIYHCTHDDIGSLLRLKARGLHYGFETSAVESNAVNCAHEVESYIIDERHKHTPHSLVDPDFRVCSYNVLADFYARTEYSKQNLFNYCEEQYLNVDYRQRLLQKEIFGYHSDIYCLQEVDEHFYAKVLRPSLPFRHMDSVYERKASTEEGLATLYDTDRFSFIADHTLILRDAVIHEHLVEFMDELRSNETFMEKFTQLHNFVQVLHLKSRSDDSKHLVVANVHLYSQLEAHSIRFVQMACIVKHIERICATIKSNYGGTDAAVIICGDFNSVPERTLNSFALNGALTPQQQRFEADIYKVESLNATHSLQLDSAYAENKYTNYTPFFIGTLDYMFFSRNKLHVKKIVPMVDESILAEDKGLPSKYLGSDHLALVSDFEWLGLSAMQPASRKST